MVIDCDVHNTFKSVRDLFPYMEPGFRNFAEHGGFNGYSLPSYLWVNPEGWARGDAIPPDGAPAGSCYELLRDQLLEPHDVEYAILTGEDIILTPCIPNPHFAAALCVAYNRWLIDEWLSLDPRLKGSIAVPAQDPAKAAEIIREFGEHPDVVQVLLAGGSPEGFGSLRYHPIYEAASDLDLVIGVHPGGDGIGMTGPPTATGYPNFYIEWHTLLCTSAMSHLVSLVAHGVFAKYPRLRWTMIELGVAWLPAIMWRLDADWKALRTEVPWVKELPSETVREHVRFTTQPLEEAPNGAQLKQLLGSYPALQEMLMFASDYPHWDAEAPKQVARRFPDGWSDPVLSDNARRHYARLPQAAARPDPIAALKTANST